MRSVLSITICLGCFAAMIQPAVAADTKTRPAPSVCQKDQRGLCLIPLKPLKSVKPNRREQYTLGLPKANKDGRTRRRIFIRK